MNLVGLAFAAAGLWLLWLAIGRRRRVLAAWAALAGSGDAPARPMHPSLSMLADVAPPLVLLGLIVAGGQVVLAFFLTDGGGGVFTLVDLAGFVLLLVGYGTWFLFKTRYRMDRPPE